MDDWYFDPQDDESSPKLLQTDYEWFQGFINQDLDSLIADVENGSIRGRKIA